MGDVLNSSTALISADSSNSSDSIKLPSSSSSDNKKKKLPKKSKRKSSKKSKVKKPSKRARGALLGPFESSTNTSNDMLLDIQHGNEGFDLHIGQTVCDDSRPSMGEEASSYFLMRHSFTYPGPLMTMLQGQMAAMMAQQQGLPASTESKFPAAISYIDYRANNWSSRLHLDMMNNQISLSFNRRLYSISKDLQIGTRLVSSYEKRKSLLEFGGKYQWRSQSVKVDEKNK